MQRAKLRRTNELSVILAGAAASMLFSTEKATGVLRS